MTAGNSTASLCPAGDAPAWQPAAPRCPQAFSWPLLNLPVSQAPQVPARQWCEAEVGFIFKFPLIMNHWRNCPQTGDKSLRPPGQEETLFTFDFPLGTGLPRLAWPGSASLFCSQRQKRICRQVLPACPPCCVNRTRGWRPGPTLEMSLPSAAWPLPPDIWRLLRVQRRAGGRSGEKLGFCPTLVFIGLDEESVDKWRSRGLLSSRQSPIEKTHPESAAYCSS